MSIDERLARLEETVAALAARIERIEPQSRVDPAASAPREQAARPPSRATVPNPLASKSTEWWLARAGAVLTCFALVLLYQYAVVHNWITPVVRVFAGTAVGVALFVAGTRTARRTDDTDIGMREVLLGAGLSAWYITAYAAAIFYSLISVSGARFLFLGLSLAGAWLALREKRSILANLALGVGFATPMLLPSDNPSIPVFSIYLATLTAVGLLLYLIRGWQLVLWLTFIAFWSSTASASEIACCDGSSIARMSLGLLIVAAAVAFMRVPVLRRALLATGSPLYTIPRRSESVASFQQEIARFFTRLTGRNAEDDSSALWTFILLSPLIGLLHLSWTLTNAPLWQWGLVALIAAALAWRAMSSPRDPDSEVVHVLAAGVAAWSLAGVVAVAWDIGPYPLKSQPLALMAASIHALVSLEITVRSRYAVPRRLALCTASLTLGSVVLWELIASAVNAPFESQWLIAELGAVALAAWIWWNREQLNIPRLAKFLGAGAYVALLFIDARVLGRVWQPLVTASYAVAGAALLIYARGPEGTRAMRRLGNITLVIVVARLLMVDLARVETIWRVLLFLGCGALFLLTSYRLQSSEPEKST